MITDSYSKMMSDVSMRSMLGEDLGMLMREQEAASDREKELSMYRSGSAPPTVEGALSSAGGLFDEELLADPSYVNYYYSNVNKNPRLPPPLLSKEDWRFSQRLHGGAGGSVVGGIGDRRKVNRNGGEAEGWGGDGLIGLPGPGLGRQKSIAEIIQDDRSQHSSRPVSRNTFDDGVESSEAQFAHLLEGVSASQGIGTPASHSYASAVGGGSLSRTTTPDPQLLARAPSPRNLPVGGGRPGSLNKRTINGHNSYNTVSSGLSESAELMAAFSGLNLSTNDQSQTHMKQHQYVSNAESRYHNMSSSVPHYGFNGYTYNPASPPMMGQPESVNLNLPPLFENVAAASAMGVNGLGPNLMAELQNQVPLVDPRYLQYLRSQEYASAQLAALNDPTLDLLGLQKAYLGQLLSPQKSHYGGAPYKSGGLSHGYYGNPALALGGSFGPGSPSRNGERNMRFGSGLRNLTGGVMGAWHSDIASNFDESFGSSLLDEFKNNKTKCFELSEISGHVVEFSADQYGSRFIQQKLETASLEEKNMVFHEIMPRALPLMTDVFGNYVIQKFFEHGSATQIRELADQLTGHVLTLSLQMYGCRVIQKAIEVVDLDQQTKMVTELDGHIMRCVRDQNGNHVIQKCIECIPENEIQFIVSTFYDHVVTLSTHPYGCRVIQRVLEHCHDPKTQSIMMDAILLHVCMLAQDQYGNYVVQHVLEHGKPEERSLIIKKLSAQIVQMSQQKFASNVVEKCLCFGTQTERQILVTEMLGTTDENEPLQAMMKDQYANYVVQKVLETCDERQLELILNRIKVHLNALKKYTYGKHIVARVEKLVAAGERRIGIQTA